MSLFALVAALLLERFHALENRARVNRLFIRYANLLERHFNAGERRQGAIAWGLGVGLPVLAALTLSGLCYALSPVLGLLFNVAVLYATLGFRCINRQVAELGRALRSERPDEAAAVLSRWTGQPFGALSATESARLGIEQTFIAAHRQVFGLVFWFILLGAGGVVLFYLALLLAQKWGEQDEKEFGRFGHFAAQAAEALEWLPLRLAAFSFAIVGDFEDAVYCWRSQADAWRQAGYGILLASGAGAVGVLLGGPLSREGGPEFRPELGLGEEADADYLDSALGLVWRSLMLWLAVLLLFSAAFWVGHW